MTTANKHITYFDDRDVIDVETVESVKEIKEERKKDSLMTKKGQERFMTRLYASLVVIIFMVSAVGVLAIPVVMARAYSPAWILLYGAYLLGIMLYMAIDRGGK